MSPSSQSHELQAAAIAYREGRFDDAETRYARILANDAANRDAVAKLGELTLLRNDPLVAARLLRQAAERTSRLTRFWPLSSQLATSEGWAHYRADRFSAAASCFSKAAGPMPFGPFRDLAAIGRHLASFADDPPYVIDGPRESRAVFVTTDPLPVLEVLLCDVKSALFFIDTGGAEVVLDRELARQLGVQIVARMRGESAGPAGTIGLGRLVSLRVADVVIRNLPVHTLDVAALAHVFGGLDVRGIIGTRLLMHFLPTIDYLHGVLDLRRRDAEREASAAEVAASSVAVIPFWLSQSHYMVVAGTVNDTGPMLFLLDTGLAGTGFSAPAGTLRRAGITVDWSAAQEGAGGFGKVKSVDFVVDQLALGTGRNRFVQRRVPGAATNPPISVFTIPFGFHVGGLVSHQFFRRSALTFDFAAMKLIVASEGLPG